MAVLCRRWVDVRTGRLWDGCRHLGVRLAGQRGALDRQNEDGYPERAGAAVSWGPLGTVTANLSPVAGSKDGAEPFPQPERGPGHGEVWHSGFTLGCGDAAVPTPAPRSSWGHRPGLWTSGRTKQHKKGVMGNKGGPPWHASRRSSPPSPSLCSPAMRSATNTTPPSFSTTFTPLRAKASSTAGSMSWATSSRYRGTGDRVTWALLALRAGQGLTSPFLCPQGGAPTPFDRNYGTKLGVKAVLWMSEKLQQVYSKGEPRAGVPTAGGGGWWLLLQASRLGPQ